VPPALSTAEQEHLSNQMAKKIEQSAQSGRGTVPAGLRRWADERLHPQVPWQRVLRNAISRSIELVHGARDFTFSRVSRREPSRPDMIPSSPVAKRIRIRVVVDTSGSMGDRDLSKALAEIGGILRASTIRDGVEVISCDSAIHSCQKVFSQKQIKLAGNGGTDMRVPLEQVREEKAATRPDVIVTCTDGETPWPKTPIKGVTVIAVITRESRYSEAPPEWIKTIKVNG
jgi:predicted metal-dependent peptidase